MSTTITGPPWAEGTDASEWTEDCIALALELLDDEIEGRARLEREHVPGDGLYLDPHMRVTGMNPNKARAHVARVIVDLTAHQFEVYGLGARWEEAFTRAWAAVELQLASRNLILNAILNANTSAR